MPSNENERRLDVPYAKYTMTYREAIDTDPTCLYLLSLDTEAHTQKLRDMMQAVWWEHEIAGETLGEFKGMLTGRLNRNKDYWIEYITAYEEKINMLDGAVTTTTRKDSTTKGENGNSNSSQNGSANSERSQYDLPRSSSAESKPSGRDVDSSVNESGSSASYESNVTASGTTEVTIKGGQSVIELKRDYLKLLRNAWEGFAMSFSPCFMDLFD